MNELYSSCEPLNEYIDHSTEIHMEAKNSALVNKLSDLELHVAKHIKHLQDVVTKQKQFELIADEIEEYLSGAKQNIEDINKDLSGYANVYNEYIIYSIKFHRSHAFYY